MMRNVIVISLVLFSFPVFAKSHHHHHKKHRVSKQDDGRPMMRMLYVKLWKHTIMDMFADAGPTDVKLVRNKLVITNKNCNDPGVKAALHDTFSSVRAKMDEIGMKFECSNS